MDQATRMTIDELRERLAQYPGDMLVLLERGDAMGEDLDAPKYFSPIRVQVTSDCFERAEDGDLSSDVEGALLIHMWEDRP